MTNEEEKAIEILDTLSAEYYPNAPEKKALDLAIKALEQQPSKDCISREQTLKAFAEKCYGECACCKYNGSDNNTAENCKLIKSIPSVTPQQSIEDWLSTFNTESATECFTAVQQLKEKIYD